MGQWVRHDGAVPLRSTREVCYCHLPLQAGFIPAWTDLALLNARTHTLCFSPAISFFLFWEGGFSLHAVTNEDRVSVSYKERSIAPPNTRYVCCSFNMGNHLSKPKVERKLFALVSFSGLSSALETDRRGPLPTWSFNGQKQLDPKHTTNLDFQSSGSD